MERLKGWGLGNVHEEGYKFGRGWSVTSYSAAMTAPRTLPLVCRTHCVDTGHQRGGQRRGRVRSISGPQDFASWQGKLAGKIVLLDPPGHVVDETEVPFHRWKPEELANPILAIPPTDAEQVAESRADSLDFGRKLDVISQDPGGRRLGALLQPRPKARSRRGTIFIARVKRSALLLAFEMAGLGLPSVSSD